jgi:hypothetical protein
MPISIVQPKPQKAEAFTIKVTGKIGKPGGSGGEAIDIEASWEGEVEPFSIEFEGLARACAGGVGADGVHDFGVTAIAKNKDGDPLPGITLKFSFEGNKGHDYGDGTPPKRAKYILGAGQTAVPDSDGEAMTAITDAEGKVPVHVLSSDIVSSDIEMKVQWTSPTGEEKDVGSQACDFAEAVGKRRFPNQYDPEEAYPEDDNGWLFGQKYLNAAGVETTAKVYLKFMKDPALGDVDGNWAYVNGHRVSFKIEEIELQDGLVGGSVQSEYALVVPNQPDGLAIHITSNDGAATAIVKAGTKINDVETIWLDATDLDQWAE